MHGPADIPKNAHWKVSSKILPQDVILLQELLEATGCVIGRQDLERRPGIHLDHAYRWASRTLCIIAGEPGERPSWLPSEDFSRKNLTVKTRKLISSAYNRFSQLSAIERSKEKTERHLITTRESQKRMITERTEVARLAVRALREVAPDHPALKQIATINEYFASPEFARERGDVD